jgi:hypothetical protein
MNDQKDPMERLVIAMEAMVLPMQKIADELMYIRESLAKVVEPVDKHGNSAIMIHDVYRD